MCVFVGVCRGFMLTQWGRWYDWEVNGTAHASAHFTGVQGDTGVTSCTGGVMVLVGIDACPYKLMGITGVLCHAPRCCAPVSSTKLEAKRKVFLVKTETFLSD
jgi:hypothetical protein